MIEMVRLGDLFEIIRNGASIKQADNSKGIPITRIETISAGVVNPQKFGYADIETNQYENYYLKTGDILMSHINSVTHLGKVAIFEEFEYDVIHGMNLLLLRPFKEKLNAKYAYYFFYSDCFKQQIQKITKKSVNQASFTITALKELNFILPSLPVQQKIAESLDMIADLIEKRKTQIVLMDKLAKESFFDMFGDPLINSKGWEEKKLKDIGKVITGNTPPRANSEYYGDFIDWIKSDNINTPNMYITKSSEMLSEVGMLKGRTVEKGAILMTCIAGSHSCIGNIAITDKKVAFNQQINAIVFEDYPETFWYIQLLLIKQKVQDLSTKGMKGIVNKSKLKSLMVLVPHVDLQNQFADQISIINKQKEVFQNSLTELETTYKATMQKAFNGELFN